MKEDSAHALRLVYAGGTIGAAGTPLSPLGGEAFRALWERALVPMLPGAGGLDWIAMTPAIDSSAAVPGDWARLAMAVTAGAAEGAPAAIVLHGTDTLAHAATALGLLGTLMDGPRPVARLAMPVTLLGAMRPLFLGEAVDPAGDAPATLAAALARPAAPGVMLAEGGRLLPGGRALKMVARLGTTAPGETAFACPNGPGMLAPLPPADPSALMAQIDRLAPHLGARSVVWLTARPEPAGRLAAELEAMLAAPALRAGAVVLAGFGEGNLPDPRHLGPAIETARGRGLPVVVTTQVAHGGAHPGGYAAGAWAAPLGVLCAGDMTPAALHAKLHLALAFAGADGWDHDTIAGYFTAPVAGEITA
ncbi:MAG: asparaginase domain-containing protein [Pseudomonadota bacterium]